MEEGAGLAIRKEEVNEAGSVTRVAKSWPKWPRLSLECPKWTERWAWQPIS
jgi:hypothetical protein